MASEPQDIVERLRQRTAIQAIELSGEAADEISRLRGEVARLEAENAEADRLLAQGEALVARVAACQHMIGQRAIGGFPGHPHSHSTGPQLCFHCGKTLDELLATAEAAGREAGLREAAALREALEALANKANPMGLYEPKPICEAGEVLDAGGAYRVAWVIDLTQEQYNSLRQLALAGKGA